jgi:2-hydroxy-3-keto-5-methylthiopentenyl-1-phosphate phosphatase
MSDIELYCAKTEFNEKGIMVSYADQNGNAIQRGFKINYLNWLKQRDKVITYIGDGLSDLEAGRAADYVFATSHLAKLLREEQVPWSYFNSFDDIRNKLTLFES